MTCDTFISKNELINANKFHGTTFANGGYKPMVFIFAKKLKWWQSFEWENPHVMILHHFIHMWRHSSKLWRFDPFYDLRGCLWRCQSMNKRQNYLCEWYFVLAPHTLKCSPTWWFLWRCFLLWLHYNHFKNIWYYIYRQLISIYNLFITSHYTIVL